MTFTLKNIYFHPGKGAKISNEQGKKSETIQIFHNIKAVILYILSTTTFTTLLSTTFQP